MIASILTSFIGSFLAFTAFFVLLMLGRTKPNPTHPVCAFCDASYPTKEQMQEHIRTCPKHPLSFYTTREAEQGRCGFVPPTRGYAPCTRAAGHSGPCAHSLAQPSPSAQGTGETETKNISKTVNGENA